jgi:hypothetical protein
MSLSSCCSCVSCPVHGDAAAAAAGGGAGAGAAGFFGPARARFDGVVAGLAAGPAGQFSVAQLEDQLAADGRELARLLFQGHLDLRAAGEERQGVVTGADGVARTRAETGHRRQLATVAGEVTVTRIAYRAPGVPNLCPADAALSLPAGKHSHGLRRLAAVEASRGSFDSAAAAITRQTGQRAGKRQVEDLARAAAADVDRFYARAQPAPGRCPDTDVLVLSADGKGIIMRPGSLRPRAAAKAAAAAPKLATRLTRGEVAHRKRIAEVAAVYDITPAPRTPADIITTPGQPQPPPRAPGPTARSKWLTASITNTIGQVIAAMFDQARRRDPARARPWIALVDGNPHQIAAITAQAARHHAQVTIIIDFIHVLEYLWNAAWSFHPHTSPAAETWVAGHARAILAGQAAAVAAAIRHQATTTNLTTSKHAAACKTARYLDTKHPYLGYPAALTAGWPITTGVIEGACRHLIKDRLDLTGARWSTKGAEAILKLRAVITNGDLDAYWAYHLTQEHQRTHPKPRTSYQLAA